MPGRSSGFLPPVIVEIVARDALFTETLRKDMALLAAFGKQESNPRLGLDDKLFLSDLATAKADLLTFAREVYDARLGADAAPLVAEIARMRAELRTLSPFDIKIDANIAAAEAQIAVLREQLAGLKTDALLGSMLGGMSGAEQLALNRRVGSMWPVPVGGGEQGGGGMGSVLTPGLLTLLGIKGLAGVGVGGGGGILGALLGGGPGASGGGLGAAFGLGGTFGLAKFGTLGSLLGFGPEHAIASGIGVGGSLVGAGLGAGLLGLGSAGVMGVGMGTDMAGIGQAAGDIRKTVAAQNALSQALAVYGRSSLQARTAQAQLNATVASFPKAAQGAIVAAANTAQQFHAMFNRLTGPAEKIGAQILQQAMKVGENFLPTIGRYATTNMGIISKSLNGKGGLFGWLKSGTKYGGLGIFKDLESIFTKNLPTGMKALTQGIELFAKVVRDSAQYVGPFIHLVAKLLTSLNSPGHAAGLARTIGHLIALFRTWMRLGFSVIKVLYHLFKPAAGLGSGLAKMLTGVFGSLDKWLGSSKMQKGLHSLFSAHFVEVVKGIGGVIKGLLPFLEQAAKGFIMVATAGARLASGPLKAAGKLLHWIIQIPFLKSVLPWVGAILLVYKALRMIWLTNPWLLALVAAILLVSYAINHWKQIVHLFSVVWKAVWGEVKTIANAVWGWIKTAATKLWHGLRDIWRMIVAGAKIDWNNLVSFMTRLPGRMLAAVASLGKMLWRWIRDAWHWVSTELAAGIAFDLRVLRRLPGQIIGAVGHLASLLWHWITTAWHKVTTALGRGIAFDLQVLRKMPGQIIHAFGNAGQLLFRVGVDILRGLWNGLKSLAGHVFGWLGHFASGLVGHVARFLGIKSPSTVMAAQGRYVMLGFLQGIQGKEGATILAALQSLAARMVAVLRAQLPLFRSVGVQLMQGLAAGIQAGTAAAVAAAVASAQAVASATKAASQTHSPSLLYMAIARDWMLGLVQGISGGVPMVQGAMRGAVGSVAPATRLPGTAGMALGGTGGSIVINSPVTINAPSGNANEILRVLGPALDKHDRQLVQRLRSGQPYR